MNFVIYVLVRTKSLAMILTGPIWPSLAYFLMSATNFCSCFSRFARSLSSSRTALLISRLFFLRTSLSGTLRPQVLPMVFRARLECCAAHGAARILSLVLLCCRNGCGGVSARSFLYANR